MQLAQYTTTGKGKELLAWMDESSPEASHVVVPRDFRAGLVYDILDVADTSSEEMQYVMYTPGEGPGFKPTFNWLLRKGYLTRVRE